jgi:TP901 family phage tail tape measure protein
MTAQAAAAGRPVADLPRFMEFGARAAGALGLKADEAGDRLTALGSEFRLDQRGIEAATNAAALLTERTGASGAGTLDFMAKTGGVAHLAGMSPQTLAAWGAASQQSGIGPDDAAATFAGLLDKLEHAPQQGKGFRRGLDALRQANGDPESA